jgi:hypothetical protein
MTGSKSQSLVPRDEELARRVAEAKRVPDKLQRLQATAAVARDIELRLLDLASETKACNAALQVLYRETLPSLFDEAKLDHIGVPPSGNKAGIDFELKSYYSASISASWPQEKRDLAFATLKKRKAEDLIKTEIVARLGRGKLPLAKKLIAAAKKLKIAVDVKVSVHSATLSSWLREVYEVNHQSLPASDLEAIGASVGRYVRPKEREE